MNKTRKVSKKLTGDEEVNGVWWVIFNEVFAAHYFYVQCFKEPKKDLECLPRVHGVFKTKNEAYGFAEQKIKNIAAHGKEKLMNTYDLTIGLK